MSSHMARDALGDPAVAGQAVERALDLAEPDRQLAAFLLYLAPDLLKRHARQSTPHAALITQILGLAEHCQDPLAQPVRQARRAPPGRSRRARLCSGPARTRAQDIRS
jgi:hypothetical protein